MSRIVAIDYGTKRTGLAVTDPLRIFATGLETVPSVDVLAYLRKYDATEGIESFVLGMPKTLTNEASENAKYVSIFLELLKKQFPDKNVFLMDERFTSSMALDTMIRGGMSKKDRKNKATIDRISATIILQSFLEMKR